VSIELSYMPDITANQVSRLFSCFNGPVFTSIKLYEGNIVDGEALPLKPLNQIKGLSLTQFTGLVHMGTVFNT
jgi:hypothetical protein